MPLLKKTQRSFAGGMIDKDLTGRQDLKKYSEGCLVLENFKVRKQGNVIKRSGTNLVCDFSGCLGSDTALSNAKIIPLVQDRAAGLYILFSAKKAFLVSQDGMKMSDGSWSQTPDGSAYSIDVPFEDSDLKMLDWCQSGDTVFFAHRSYPPGKIVYRGGQLAYERLNFRQASGKQPIIKSVVASSDFGDGSTKEVEYCVTAVKDGIESAPSPAYAVSYQLPWGSKASFKITIDSASIDTDDFDTFYIYKKESDVFGLIGATSNQVSFVDISKDFSVNGNLFPPLATEFDEVGHLAETRTRIPSYTKTTPYHHFKHSEFNGESGKTTKYELGPALDPDELKLWSPSLSCPWYWYGTVDVGLGTPTRCKKANTLTYNVSGTFSNFEITVGFVMHKIDSLHFGESTGRIVPIATGETLSKVEYYKYTGKSSVFYASPAKWIRARVEYLDGSTWKTSAWFDCENTIDQSALPSEWREIGSESGVRMFERTYAESEQIVSIDDLAHIVSRMDGLIPAVGSTFKFQIPTAVQGKKIRKITLEGYTDKTYTTSIGIVSNGISCYIGGKYVYTFTDDYITPDLTITPPKTTDHFVNPGEYPGCVQLYSQRLVYGSSTDYPFTFWMSTTGDLYNFDTHEYLRASDAITASTAALEMPRINRMLVHRDLMLFAEGGEWQVSTTSGNAVSPTTIAAKLQSAIGCAAWLKPIPIDTDILFCDSSGEALLATRYNFATDGYESSNLSVLSQRLFRNNPIMAMAFAQFPESTVECVLADGTIASLVYMKEHDVCAWSLHRLGGGWLAKDVAANKAIDAGSSNCAFIARRKNGDAVQWAVLALRDIDPNDSTLEGNLRMDAVRISGTEPTAGAGETVVRIGDAKWAVGSTFESVIKTTSPEFSEQETAQMEIKNATEVEVRVIDGSTFTARQSDVSERKATTLAVPCEVSAEGADYTVAPGDADCRLPITGTNTRNGSIVIRHNGYLPIAILSVSTAYRIEFANHANGGSDNGRG